MAEQHSTARKRKARRKALSLGEYANKYGPLLRKEEAADRESADRRKHGNTIANVLSGNVESFDFLSAQTDPWDQVSRSAAVRVLRHAIKENDIEAIKMELLGILSMIRERLSSVFIRMPNSVGVMSPRRVDNSFPRVSAVDGPMQALVARLGFRRK